MPIKDFIEGKPRFKGICISIAILGTLNTWYGRTDSIVAIRSARFVTVFQKTSNWLADNPCVAIAAGYLRVDEVVTSGPVRY